MTPTCRFCDQPRVAHRLRSRPAPETCGAHRCRGLLTQARGGEAWRTRMRQCGRKGGRTSHVKKWAAFLEVWMNRSPREALRLAYGAGYHAGHQSRPDVKAQAARRRKAA